MNKIPTVCYILSASHSGSTVINITLAERMGAIGVGESRAVLSKKNTTLEDSHTFCSCGQEMPACPFWADIYRTLGSQQNGLKQGYQQIIQTAQSLGHSMIIDSSKNISFLKILEELHAENVIDLKVIFLVRDVRGWVASQKAIASRDKQNHFLLTLRRIRNWVQFNKQMYAYIQTSDLNYIVVSYEKFSFETENTIKTISTFLGRDLVKDNSSEVHIAFGNRAKKTYDPDQPLQYDYRWLSDYWIQLYIVLLFPIFFWNKKFLFNSHKKQNVR